MITFALSKKVWQGHPGRSMQKLFNKRKQELEKAEADEVSNINFPYATQEMFEAKLILL